LECTVSLLTDYESATSYLDWEIGKHGMILEFTDPESVRHSATYLPEIAAQEGWTKIETVDSLVRKAGYMGPLTESMRCKFRITRYQSSLCTMHYSEYAAYVKHIRGSAPMLTVKC
jgi:AMMECR1 domain-containing protein